MTIKKYHVSKNLAWTGWAQDFVARINDLNNANIISDDDRTVLRIGAGAGYGDYDNKYIFKIDFEENTQYTISFYGKRPSNQAKFTIMRLDYTDNTFTEFTPKNDGNYTYYTIISSPNKTVKYLRAAYTNGSFNIDINTFMVNTGSTALPYEPYGNTWNTIPYRKYDTETNTLTTLPKTIIGDGTAISAYTIKGNMAQSGTPTPQNPIYPTECGDKTANLCSEYLDKSTINSNGVVEQNGVYDLALAEVKANAVYSALPNWTTGNCVFGFFTQKPARGSTTYNGERLVQSPNLPFSFTSPIDGWVAIWSRIDSNPKQFMLVEGATIPTAFEPYGYKIPISCGGTITNVYLGEVQSTRQIKKLVLTGEENDWIKASGYNVFANTSITSDCYNPSGIITCMCSHYAAQGNVSGARSVNDSRCCFRTTTKTFYIGDNTYADLNDFLLFLQQQYANGTPVTILYVLAESTTGIVNEPIRKISDYADSVARTGIPTTGSAEPFDVSTTLKPSEVSLTYHGWHEHSDTKFTT